MKIKNVLIVSFCCLATLVLGGCAKAETAVPDKIYVGVASYDQSDTFINELSADFEEKVKQLGDKAGLQTVVSKRYAANSQRLQNSQIKELIDAGCNVLCVNLVDRTNTSEIIELAKENNVPVIFFNREPVAEDLKQWDKLYYVGANAKESGVMQGELAADAILQNKKIDRNQDGKIQYVVLEGEPGHQHAIIRTEEAVNTLRSQGIQLDKLGYALANWNRAQAENRMQQLIEQHQNNIELVLSNNDDMALGGIDAYAKLNRTESSLPVFFGIDGTDPGLKAVEEGKLAGTVYNDKEGQAGAMAELATALVSGKGLDDIQFENGKYVYVQYSKVTKENVGEY